MAATGSQQRRKEIKTRPASVQFENYFLRGRVREEDGCLQLDMSSGEGKVEEAMGSGLQTQEGQW